MYGIYILGSIVQDTAVRSLDGAPDWGTAVNLESISEHLGGNGAVTAYAAARLGSRVRLTGAVGCDAAGDFALTKLQAAGVDTSLVRRERAAATARTVALVRADGQRTFLQAPGATARMSPDDIRFDSAAVADFSLFHYGSIFNLTSLRPYSSQLLSRARAAGLRTSLDLDWDPAGEWIRLIEPLCPLLDYLFVNREEGEAIAGARGPDEVGRKLLRLGPKTVILKLGAEGCRVFDGSDSASVAAPAVEAVDTTGAGDIFCGAFLAAVERGLDLRRAARFAVEAGAESVRHVGAAEGLESYRPAAVPA